MTKLELKHLACYLPYGLKVFRDTGETTDTLELSAGKIMLWQEGYYESFKPILRPLSDLTKEIEHNGEKIIPGDVLNTDFSDLIALPETYKHGRYNIVSSLIEWHFDVFDLIPAGLAISYKEAGL